MLTRNRLMTCGFVTYGFGALVRVPMASSVGSWCVRRLTPITHIQSAQAATAATGEATCYWLEAKGWFSQARASWTPCLKAPSQGKGQSAA